MDNQDEKVYTIEGFEGMQIGTSRFLKKKGELDLAQNTEHNEIGSVSKKKGYTQRGNPLTSTTSTSSSSTTTTSTSSSTSTTTTSTSTT